MKKLKKYIMLLIILAMLPLNTVKATSDDKNQEQGVEILKQKIELLEKEKKAILTSESAIRNQEANKIYQTLINNICVNDTYPEYYGGAYINDYNKLVVVLIDPSEEKIQLIKEEANSQDIIVQSGEVSLNYLKRLQNEYSQRYEEIACKVVRTHYEEEFLSSYCGSAIIEGKNKLVVKVNELSDEREQIFRSILGNGQSVTYENAEKAQTTASAWKVGRGIYDSGGTSSTGYRAYYIDFNGTRYNGFVTAGHSFSIGDYVYKSSNLTTANRLGVCKLSMFTGDIDAAFIAVTNSSYEPSNTLYYSDGTGSTSGTLFTLLATTIATNSDICAGTYVYSVGTVTYLKTGTISSTSETVVKEDKLTGKNTYLVDLVTTNIQIQKGDSGGCLFMVKNGGFAVIGTTSGRYDQWGAFVNSYFSKASNQIASFGIVKY